MKYAHTNIVAQDWKRLARFYCQVFSCEPVPPERNQAGSWLDRGTGVTDARIQGMHLRLPGYGDAGPTLEIYQYSDVQLNTPPVPNRQGFGHLAFEVDDVGYIRDRILEHGGCAVGEISEVKIGGVGQLTFVYMADPEGNILEIQQWG